MPTPKINIAERSFSGNPVFLSLYVGVPRSARYRIRTVLGVVVFEGEVYSTTDWSTVDISSVVAIEAINAEMFTYEVLLLDGAGNTVETKQFTVYPGGISKLMQRKLIAAGTDIFALKIKNHETNFFLSTRSFNTELFIPENELMPLFYYAKGMKFKIRVSQNTCELDGIDGTGYPDEVLEGIDFAALRLYYANEYDVWANDFRIVTDNGWSCSVIITEGNETPFYLKFRNSFGMFEKIALYQESEYAPTFQESEKVLTYDAAINGLKTTNRRKEITNKYRFNTRYMSANERMFLIDALLAKETFIEAYGVEYEASITCSADLFAATNAAPMAFSITAELADKDNYFSPLTNDTINVLTSGGNELTSNNADITT